MNENNDKKNIKLLYTIGEIAEMFDVNVSLIRHWSNYFDVLKPKTNRKGNRLYTNEDIDIIKIIYNLVKDRGMRLDAAQRYIKTSRTKADQDVVVIQKLMDIKSLLTEVLYDLGDDHEATIYKG